ncbi:MAG: glycosyltransferase involved in cell wall biosynthesis, partial [Gammaproteobacteria bacterium]
PMTITGSLNMPENWLTHPELVKYQDKLSQILTSELEACGNTLWGFKDPHTIRLLPLWESLFQANNIVPIYLLCIRNPVAVADSLYRRDKINRDHAELLWLQHYLAGLRLGSKNIATVIEYERWFSDFDRQLQELMNALGIEMDTSAKLVHESQEFVDIRLNHGIDNDSIKNPLTAKLYKAIQDYSNESITGTQLDNLSRDLNESADSFSQWTEIIETGIKGPRSSKEYFNVISDQSDQTHVTDKKFRSLGDRLDELEIGTGEALNVCIVTYALEGPVKHSGIGAEAADMALALAKMGHKVTVLYVPRQYCEYESFKHWVEFYRDKGVELVGLNDARVPSSIEWKETYSPGAELLQCRPGAYNTYHWLKGKKFDVVHSFDTFGALFYCLLSKRLGLRFNKVVFHVRVRGPQKFKKYFNAIPLSDVQELSSAYMERRVVELADVVTASSESVLQEFLKDAYSLPMERCFILPYIGSHHSQEATIEDKAINEIVFYGGLEPRKGLNLFVDAIDWLHRNIEEVTQASGGGLPSIIFLGSQRGDYPGIEFLENRTGKWDFSVKWHDKHTRSEALSYISKGNKLVVFPSPENITSIGLLECIQFKIPFIAANTAANRSILGDTENHPVLFDLHPKALSESLLRALGKKIKYAEGDLKSASDNKAWYDWHRSIADSHSGWRRFFQVVRDVEKNPAPFVSVCVAHFNRPHFLKQALASLEAQTYRNFEVIVVDDGSFTPEALQYLNEIEPELGTKGWKIVRQENRYLGAVRNTGARHATGRYCLFMDDDNYAKPNEIETFVKIAEQTGAEILTCFADVFDGLDPPDVSSLATRRIIQLGDSLPMGLFRNGFGDSNCFVQREFFLDIGGNSEDYKVGKDDQEFFARAVLNDARLFLVPEALYWYRESEVRMRDLHYNAYAGNLRVLRPYLDACHPEFRDIFRFAQGQMVTFQKFLGRERFRKEQARLYREEVKRRKEEARKRREAKRQRKLRELDAMLNSSSWRITRPLRNVSRIISGGDDQEMSIEQYRDYHNPQILIISVNSSMSWKITGPLRALSRKPFMRIFKHWFSQNNPTDKE